MNILVSCMGYDGGKSGISTYMQNVVANLKDSPHSITLVLEYDSVENFKDFKKIVVSKFFKSFYGNALRIFYTSFFYG